MNGKGVTVGFKSLDSGMTIPAVLDPLAESDSRITGCYAPDFHSMEG